MNENCASVRNKSSKFNINKKIIENRNFQSEFMKFQKFVIKKKNKLNNSSRNNNKTSENNKKKEIFSYHSIHMDFIKMFELIKQKKK